MSLRRGETGGLALEMRRAGLVELQARTTFGRSRVLVAVLLREGESHPKLPQDAEGLRMLEHKGHGVNLSPPLETGTYVLSVGGFGRALLRSEPRELEAGELVHAETVVDRGFVLKVVVDASIEVPEAGGTISLLESEGEHTKRDGTITERWRSSERARVRAGDFGLPGTAQTPGCGKTAETWEFA
ncbi:MAG TPA: hypothetical protein VGC54_10140 [Planctomycetota bacterium]